MRTIHISIVIGILLCLVAVLLIWNLTDCATLRVGGKTAELSFSDTWQLRSLLIVEEHSLAGYGCGFSESRSIQIGGLTYCLAQDDCNSVYIKELDFYYTIPEACHKILDRLILEYTNDIISVPSTSEKSDDAVLSYASWTEDERIYTNSLNITEMKNHEHLHPPIYVFDTVYDLQNFKYDFGEILTLDAGLDEVPSFNAATERYDNAFFQENTLILVYVPANNSTHRFGLSGIEINDTQCHIHLEETTGAEAVDAAMAGWFLTIAVADEAIAACTEFDADLNNIDGQLINPNLRLW